MHFEAPALDCAGPPPTWIHGHNRLSGRRAPTVACPGGGTGAIVHPVAGCFERPHLIEDGDGGDQPGRTGTCALGEHGKAPYVEVQYTSRPPAWGWESAYRCDKR